MSQTKVYVTEKSVSESLFVQKEKFLSDKMLLSQKQVDRNLKYQHIVLSWPKGKCKRNDTG